MAFPLRTGLYNKLSYRTPRRYEPVSPLLPTMVRKVYLLFTLFFSFTVLHAVAARIPPVQASQPQVSFGYNSTEFIRARCGATRYPSLCYRSLAGYSFAVQQSPIQLARFATNLTLARVASLYAHVASLRRACGTAKSASACPEAGALRDCADSLGDAVDLARRTAGELCGLEAEAAGSAAAVWRMSNAQTWMSAALTDEDTCVDGFEEVGQESRAKADVCRRVWRVKQYTSNALALVNGIVASR
ncbi:hypothetical protein OPV22_028256 [Ensete ventricosum]|uniref:Pectinesterase inhibitor domain-containing protein n=1 Tax=Ensete ventricosum TaxID=4639 RepID=A0AAV8Q2L6_ENSVE|nr:hypothetical protein OPV22_028256 [Ensete ventricosum]